MALKFTVHLKCPYCRGTVIAVVSADGDHCDEREYDTSWWHAECGKTFAIKFKIEACTRDMVLRKMD